MICFNIIAFTQCFKKAGLPNECELLFKNPTPTTEIDLTDCLKRNNKTPQLLEKIADECVPAKE